ncbi:MAG: hypothetical protein IPH59_01160 [bacterium]|nr:hypothetical protein [bacterium]
MQEVDTDKKTSHSYNLTGGLIVLGIGIFFLLVNLDILPPVHESWPLILILVGVALIVSKIRR